MSLRHTGIAAHTVGLWTFGLLLGCSDLGTIGALCPVGCEPRAHDGVCVCTTAEGLDAGRCADSCSPEADAAVGNPADACAQPGCEEQGTMTPRTQCTAGSYPLARKRLDLLVVVDDEASLSYWWPVLSEGFLAFIQDKSSHGTGVGMQRFGSVCENQSYPQTLAPIELLPGNQTALQQAFPSFAVENNSTVPALAAALQYAKSWATEHQDSQIGVVLITDASPGACDALIGAYPDEAARIASTALSGSPSIKTYVVGGGGLSLIDSIASAGGTQAFPIGPLDSSVEVLNALRAVQADASPCEFALPQNHSLAPDSRVLVDVPGGMRLDFAIERGPSTCQRAGFYVPDETAAYPLIGCPHTCAAIANSDQLSLSTACDIRR
jgi:hypothetical protein